MALRFRITPDELRRSGLFLFGDGPGWQSRLAENLGVDRSAVTRWLSGSVPVPVYASLLVRYMTRFGLPEKAFEERRDGSGK